MKITPQINIRKFEEQTARGQGPGWESYLTSPDSRGPYGYKKLLPARYPSSSRLFFKFSDLNLGSDFDPFSENLTCIENVDLMF